MTQQHQSALAAAVAKSEQVKAAMRAEAQRLADERAQQQAQQPPPKQP